MAKILIVEDDPSMSRMYKRSFAFEGYEVEIAEDGQQGIDMARSVKPAMILMDIMMPNMNGLEALERLKGDPETKGIPIVMLTNLGSDKDAETALSKGALQYIIKSEHEPEEVVGMIKEILSKNTPSTT